MVLRNFLWKKASDEGHLFSLAGGDEAVVEALDDGVVPDGDQGSHVEGTADLGAASEDGAPAVDNAVRVPPSALLPTTLHSISNRLIDMK